MSDNVKSDINEISIEEEPHKRFHVIYNFGESTNSEETDYTIQVTKDDVFSYEKGYGFITEEAIKAEPRLAIEELNSGFSPYYWYKDAKLINPQEDYNGVFLPDGMKDGGYIPLTFATNVPHQGNYKVTLTINAGDRELKDIAVFSGRRRLEALRGEYSSHETRAYVFNINVCDIIPRGHTEVFEDTTLDLTIIGNSPVFTSISIEEYDTPTIYICGDSTVTDQPANYPYFPESSYCGWGQFFSYYVSNWAAVSNHSHSGLTTESFRSEGHYDIVKKYIKPGDYCLFQFGHNDQKLPHLAADKGYTDNLIRYIDEIREMGATPVIVTPLARTTWKGSDGSYNDLLFEHSEACKKVAATKNAPLIDLHQVSMDFVKRVGLTQSVRYYYPKDYTHTNDYGAYLYASLVAKEIKKINDILPIPIRSSLLGKVYDHIMDSRYPQTIDKLLRDDGFIPPEQIKAAEPPAHLKSSVSAPMQTVCEVKYDDIASCPHKELIEKIAGLGYIHDTEGHFCPDEPMSRIDAVNMVTKAARFVPVYVYNDMYTDVVGHEWYAGVVECAYQNALVDEALLSDKTFKPQKELTAEEMISFCVNAFNSRIIKSDIPKYTGPINCSSWFMKYADTAAYLGYITDDFCGTAIISKEQAVVMLDTLIKNI